MTSLINLHLSATMRTKKTERRSYSGGCTVVQCWVTAPAEALIGGEFARALAFEEEDAFAEGVAVVVAGGGGAEEEEEQGEDRDESVWRHFVVFSSTLAVRGGVCGCVRRERKRSRLLYKRESILGFQCLVQCAFATWRQESGLFSEPDAWLNENGPWLDRVGAGESLGGE